MSDIKQKAYEIFKEKVRNNELSQPNDAFGYLDPWEAIQEINLDGVESFIDQIIDMAISDYQTNEEQKHIASAVEVERKRIVEIINSKIEDDYKIILQVSEDLHCNCNFDNGDIVETDEHQNHIKCGRKFPIQVPLKSSFQQFKEDIVNVITNTNK